MTLALSGFSDLPCHCIDFPDMPAELLTTMLAVHYTRSTFIPSARSILLDSFAAFITSAFLWSFSALCCCNSINDKKHEDISLVFIYNNKKLFQDLCCLPYRSQHRLPPCHSPGKILQNNTITELAFTLVVLRKEMMFEVCSYSNQ